MTIIYRVQDKDGRGPWKPGLSRYWVEDRDDHQNLIPFYQQFPSALRGAITGMHVGCGCRTVEQLRRWFSPVEYGRLLMMGYRSVEMDVGRILGESDIQTLFERAMPLRIGVTPFDLYAQETA